MWFSHNTFFLFSVFYTLLELPANCYHANGTSLLCLLKVNETESHDSLTAYQNDLNLLLDEVPQKIRQKLLPGSLFNFTTEEIIQLPTSLLYFLPINKLGVLSGDHLASLLIAHEDNLPIAKKILQSVLNEHQRIEFLNFLISNLIRNDKVLNFIGETVYKWNYDVQDGKFQKLSNVCGYTLARLWAPYVLTRNKPISIRLLTLLAEVEQKQNRRALCNKYTQLHWKNLPKSIRRLWVFLAVNQSYPSPLKSWTVEQIAQYKFLLPDMNNNELSLIPFDELSKMELHDIDFDKSQAQYVFSLLMENNTLKDVKILYPTFFFKLSPLQINQFEPAEWAEEKAAIASSENTYLSYAAAKQIFNKIADDRLSSKSNLSNVWTSEDLRHLPLLYTQPATSFLKFCTTPPSVQSLIAIDSYMLTDRQSFYLSGCSSMLSFQKNDPKLLLGLKYMLKALPVSSLLNFNTGNMHYQLASHLVSSIDDRNLPMALHLLNVTNPVNKHFFVEEMLKNKHNVLFEQLAPSDIPGPVLDVLKQLYSNHSNRIDKLPKHLLNVILESNELLIKWTGNESSVTKGLYNGYTCNFIKKLNSAQLIVSISNYNAYLKQNGKVFPKNLQICFAEAFIDYLKLKSKFTADLSSLLYLEAWEIEAVQGFVLTTLPVDVIINSVLRDNILKSIGQLSFPELIVASQPDKLSLITEKYISIILTNSSTLSYDHLYILGNLIHFIDAKYLNLVDEQAFKFFIETGLFDTRICVDSFSKEQWSNLIIKSFGNIEHWSSDTLITLSDLLIALNQDQFNSILNISRLNSADIIQTRYADEIECLLDNNIPFYKSCELILGDQYVHFTDSLSALINFHLVSIQNQLHMITPISYNHHYEGIIKSSEAKPKIVKPNILIPIPEFDNMLSTLSSYLLNKYFAGKEKHNVTESYSSTEKSIQVITPTTNELISTKSTSMIEVQNFTILSTLNPKDIEKKLSIDEDTKLNINPLNFLKTITFSPPKITEKSEFIDFNITSASLDLKNGNKFHDIKNDAYSVNSQDSISPEVIEISIIDQQNNSSIDHNKKKKRSLELFFNSAVQISCEALKIVGPASVNSKQFNSIIHSMSDEELNNCVDLLGSFDIDSNLARYIWSKIDDKIALHTFGSVLSGLSVDDIKTIDMDINKPWSLELIHLLSKHIKSNDLRKEIIKQFMTKSKANMMLSHMWGSFGSLLCHLQPRTFKIIMPNKELFWRTSSAYKNIRTCDTPCIQNLASIAVSVIGPSDVWKTAEVELMGIIPSGINITQWQLLLNFNPEALEGLSPNAVKCLNEQQIKLMNESHIKHLTPKSAHILMKNHYKYLNYQSKEKLNELMNFEIHVDWQSTPIIFESNTVEGHNLHNSKTDNIIDFESTKNIAPGEMQANSRGTTNCVLSFSVLSAIVLLHYLKYLPK